MQPSASLDVLDIEYYKYATFIPGRARTKGSLIMLPNGSVREGVEGSSSWRKIMAGRFSEWRRSGGVPTLRCAVVLRTVFFLPRKAKSELTRSYPTARGTGDLDKLIRNLGDALDDAGVLVDDSQIVCHVSTKEYESRGRPPGVQVGISPIDEF